MPKKKNKPDKISTQIYLQTEEGNKTEARESAKPCNLTSVLCEVCHSIVKLDF